MFVFVFSLNVLINLDHGIIPACTTQLELDLNLTPTELGLFGSLLFAGNAVGKEKVFNYLGSILTMAFIDKFNRKYSILVCILLCGVGLLTFTFSKSVGFLFFNRFLVGIFQVIFKILFHRHL